MPYVKEEDRFDLDEYLNHLTPVTAGELNYVFTVIIRDYFKEYPNYQGINDIIGALEGAKAEFQRRVVAPYEDTKIVENGDVY